MNCDWVRHNVEPRKLKPSDIPGFFEIKKTVNGITAHARIGFMRGFTSITWYGIVPDFDYIKAEIQIRRKYSSAPNQATQ